MLSSIPAPQEQMSGGKQLEKKNSEIPSLLLRLVQLLLASSSNGTTVPETQLLSSFEYAMRLLNRYYAKLYTLYLLNYCLLPKKPPVPVKDSRRDPCFGHGQEEA